MRCLGWHDRHQTCTVRLSPSPSTLLPNPTENNTPRPSPLPWLFRLVALRRPGDQGERCCH